MIVRESTINVLIVYSLTFEEYFCFDGAFRPSSCSQRFTQYLSSNEILTLFASKLDSKIGITIISYRLPVILNNYPQ